MHPELKARQLYLTGESYGGKYLPLFAHAIFVHNENPKSPLKIPLHSVMISDPLPSPAIERTQVHTIPSAQGILDRNNMNQISALEQKCWTEIGIDETKAADTCEVTLAYIKEVSHHVAWYDSRIFLYDFYPLELAVTNLFTRSPRSRELIRAIHMEDSTRDPVFSYGSSAVKEAYRSDQIVDYSFYYNYLIKKPDFPFMVQVGEFDMQDGYKSQVSWMRELLDLPTSFWSQDRKAYFFYNEDGNQRIGGYYRKTGNFTFMSVPKAGHFVPYGNYDGSKAILDDYVNHDKLLCKSSADTIESSDKLCRSVDAMCSMMNQCSQHGTCNDVGTCECTYPYKGADCSWKAVEAHGHLFMAGIATKGQEYIYFAAPKMTDDMTLEITSTGNSSISLYLDCDAQKGNPNLFKHELKYNKIPAQKTLKLSAGTLPMCDEDTGFVGMVEVHGFDVANNKVLDNYISFSTGSSQDAVSFLM